MGVTGHFENCFHKTAFSYSNTYWNTHAIWSTFRQWSAKKFEPRLPETVSTWFQQKNWDDNVQKSKCHEGRDTRVSQTRSERQTRSFVRRCFAVYGIFNSSIRFNSSTSSWRIENAVDGETSSNKTSCRSFRVWETFVSRPSWYYNASELKKVFHPPEKSYDGATLTHHARAIQSHTCTSRSPTQTHTYTSWSPIQTFTKIG